MESITIVTNAFLNRMIKGQVGTYRAPDGYNENDYVVHHQLSGLYNDIRKLKSTVDKAKEDLQTNTDVDFWTRVFILATSLILTMFGVLIRIKTAVNKIKSKDGKQPQTEIQLRSLPPPSVNVPQYSQNICPY